MPEEDSHETESLLARSSISETQETLEIVIPEAGLLLSNASFSQQEKPSVAGLLPWGRFELALFGKIQTGQLR